MAKKPSSFKKAYIESRDKIHAKKSERIILHRSFHRSHREDYQRDFEAPGLLQHTFDTFKVLFKNWKTFGLLILLAAVLNIVLVGLMSEETYTEFQNTFDQTSTELATGKVSNVVKAGLLLVSTIATGGLNQGASEVQQVFIILIFLLVWLTTIFLARHFLAGNHPKLRDGLYNACTPLISTFCVFAIIFFEFIPVLLVVVTYSAAVNTDFLSTPFYALVYFIFAALMLLLSGYLLSSSLMALVAVTTPGIYPMRAIYLATDLMAGRRMKFIVRLLFLIFVISMVLVIIMLPIILLDIWLKSCISWLAGIPIVSLFLLLSVCFIFVYATIYLYLYYRRMLSYDKQK